MPRDRIVILEDTDGDGVADKRTVFAEGKDFPVPQIGMADLGFDLASGLEVGYGGCLRRAPAVPVVHRRYKGPTRPASSRSSCVGLRQPGHARDAEHLPVGPDGWLYGLHGIFTTSKVEWASPARQRRAPDGSRGVDAPGSQPIDINAGVWRYHPAPQEVRNLRRGHVEPVGLGLRNTDGQMILCCCVIPHLFHIVPGGIYKRQSGQSHNPYAYGTCNEICDHTFHKESGWAHAGLLSLDTPLMPEEYRDSVIFGSIHGCSIKRNVLNATARPSSPAGPTISCQRRQELPADQPPLGPERRDLRQRLARSEPVPPSPARQVGLRAGADLSDCPEGGSEGTCR